TSFVTPSISSTTTYYVEASNGGCTSPRTAVVATVNNSPTATVNQTGNTLTVQESGLSYQWVDCNNSNVPILGENGQSFNVTVNGNYAVEVTENGCVTTSNCTNVTVTNVESISTINEFSIYPNPVADEHVSIHSTQGVEQVRIYDAIGKIVYFQNFNNEKQLTISLQNFEKGIYFIQVNKSIQKLIVE
ncbi:MAG: T9SS type A sorting domain-containing protein, partial [Flavobacteriales bacterium]|nr:T9SS type A sorting domain-containing protein [Flavobacteriales bacterium]